jgi:hypothetical protein
VPVAHNVAAHFFIAFLPRQLEQSGMNAGKLLFAVHVPDEDSAGIGQSLVQLSSLGLAELLLSQNLGGFPQRQAPAVEKPERVENTPVRHIDLAGANVPQGLRQSVDGVRPRSSGSVADQLDPVLVGHQQVPTADGANHQGRRAGPAAAVEPPPRFPERDRSKKVRPWPQQHGVVYRAARAAGRQHLCPRNRQRDQGEPQRLPRRRAPQPGQQ